MENKCPNIYFQMNYNIKVVAQHYVSLQNIGGYSDTATVTITVEDFDNLNPYFHHSLYKALTEENQVNDVRGQDQCFKHMSDHTNETLCLFCPCTDRTIVRRHS